MQMILTMKQKQDIILSFSHIIPISGRFARIFYNRLWEIAPQTQALFGASDMEIQRQKLIKTLSAAITGLDNLENLSMSMQKIGRSHQGYGVSIEDYNYMGEALIWSLEQELRQSFTEDVKQAWETLYTLMAGIATEMYMGETFS